MSSEDSLKKIEREAYRTVFSDGLADIAFGLLFMIFALNPILEHLGMSRFIGYPFFLLPALFFWLGKRHVTIPRLGSVTFGAKRKTKRKLFVLIIIAVIFLQLPLLFMMGDRAFPGIDGSGLAVPVTIFSLAALCIALAAYFLSFPRMYIYALVLMFAIPHAEFMHRFLGDPLNYLLSFGVPGIVVLIYGFGLLAKFKQTYPKSVPEVPHVSGS